ncbi:hypothetical protein [Eggerthella sinensis]|uniref:hypothetical protein n=1 Tax=Eggerthella sinensis TaxID=242230 RepID=UPI0022E1CA6B|nr:hypothetical protein [Eggerthella sinensis]
MMTTPLLSMDDVSLSFKTKNVLNHLSFAIESGSCFGFLGPSAPARPPPSSCSRANW